MDTETKKALLEATLTRAAEQLGDVTAPAIALYFRRFPEACEAFERLWSGSRGLLEGEMVAQSLYCMMNWFDSPGEIEIVLLGSVPHHAHTLKVPPGWYGGLLNAVADTIEATIPVGKTDERAVWREMRGELIGLIETSAQYV